METSLHFTIIGIRIGSLFEISYRLLMIEKEPPMTRFITSQLSTDHWFDVSAAQRDFGFTPSSQLRRANAVRSSREWSLFGLRLALPSVHR